MTTETMQIKVTGELGRVPGVAGIIQASVRMYAGTAHEGTGDLFFERFSSPGPVQVVSVR
jgi:hypothetical protein